MTVLDSQTRQHPDMIAAEAMLRTLATTLPEVTLPAGLPHLAAAEARLAGGIPALEGELLLNGAELLANVRALTGALGEMAETTQSVPEVLERAMVGSAVDSLAAGALAGTWDLVAEMACRASLDSHLLITLVDHAARPSLRAGAATVRELTSQCRWMHGTCPCCGAPPLLAELRSGRSSPGGAEQERVLRCGRCLAAWAFSRLRCIGCGETRHQQLSYLHGAGEGEFRRADVCSTCGTYLKSIAVLAPLGMLELLKLDLATAALDVAAVEQGFHR